MGGFRTPETAQRYIEDINGGMLERSCPLCDGPALKEFTYWKIMRNLYPYDKIAHRHDMIVPLRHAREPDLTIEERTELWHIKEGYLHTNYDYILEATHKRKSIPEHFHLHLINVF